jgi:hypothetical protein
MSHYETIQTVYVTYSHFPRLDSDETIQHFVAAVYRIALGVPSR